MTAITISRQMGTQGLEIAQAVGERLGYRVLWRELINQAAIECGSPEIALATIDELGLLGIKTSGKVQQVYIEAVRGIVEHAADQGHVVIVGRAGQAILRHRPDVFHVRIHAPLDWRCESIAKQQRIALQAAKAQVEASDHTRQSYLQRFYQIQWDDPDLYDVILNNQRLTIDDCAEIICFASETHTSTLRNH